MYRNESRTKIDTIRRELIRGRCTFFCGKEVAPDIVPLAKELHDPRPCGIACYYMDVEGNPKETMVLKTCG